MNHVEAGTINITDRTFADGNGNWIKMKDLDKFCPRTCGHTMCFPRAMRSDGHDMIDGQIVCCGEHAKVLIDHDLNQLKYKILHEQYVQLIKDYNDLMKK